MLLAVDLLSGTTITVSAAIAAIGVFVSGTWWIANKIRDLLEAMEGVGDRLTKIEQRLRDGWTIQHQKIWSLQLQNDNRDLKVPDPYDIAEHGKQ